MKKYKKVTTKQTINRLGWIREAMVEAKEAVRVLNMEVECELTKGGNTTSCGTAACVFGWAALSPKFRRIGLHTSNAAGISSSIGSEAAARKVWGYASFGEDLVGLSLFEAYALGSTQAYSRFENARMSNIPTDFAHFHVEKTSYDNVIEVIDFLINRYMGY